LSLYSKASFPRLSCKWDFLWFLIPCPYSFKFTWLAVH
jgi:hypothetical protein